MDENTDILYQSKNGFITGQDIRNILTLAGIEQGDTLFIHSDISTIGRPVQRDKDILLGGIVNAFKEAVGSQGTLIMPTFTYSFCKGEKYDINDTPSTVGVLTEYFRKQPGVIRTRDPIFSVAIWGKNAEKFKSVGKVCFGEESIFNHLHKNNGKIVMFGTPKFSLTHLHFIEQKVNVSYRFMKKFSGTIRDNVCEYEDEFFYYVRKLDERSIPDEPKIHDILMDQKIMNAVPLGYHRVEVFEEKRAYEVLYQILLSDPYSILL